MPIVSMVWMSPPQNEDGGRIVDECEVGPVPGAKHLPRAPDGEAAVPRRGGREAVLGGHVLEHLLCSVQGRQAHHQKWDVPAARLNTWLYCKSRQNEKLDNLTLYENSAILNLMPPI